MFLHRFFYRLITLFTVLAILTGTMPMPRTRAQTSQAPFPWAASTSQVSNPLSLARVQSNYTGGTTIIAFTLTNNLPHTRLPEIAQTATQTETVETLASFVISDDVNTLRGVTLADSLASGVSFLAASGSPAQNGSTLTWSLLDLPPQASATITLTVQTPAQGGDFISLDAGAQAQAEQWGQPVSRAARPVAIIPAGISAAYTTPTVDADSLDADMLWKSADLAQDPLALFAYVRGLGFDPYKGSLRGTRGTLWGQAGNSVDLSSLLIAMLRAAGTPARYRHGVLATADAQGLLTSMFPAAQGVAGNLPPGALLADPLNDPVLLALVQDHWWVEAYLPGSGWTNLDPSFDSAQPGDVFATPGGNDRIAELPDTLRHNVTFTLEVEQYSQFPIHGVNLISLFPVDVTFSTAELASRPLTFGHLVATEAQGGLYSNILHTYTPYFTVEGSNDYTLGETFQDFLTNFPLATTFTTAAWLTVETQDTDGNSETFTREIKDLIGKDVRLNGGTPNISPPANNAALFGPGDALVMWFLPNNALNNPFTNRYREALFARSQAFAADLEPALDLFSNPSPTSEEFALLSDATLAFQLNRARYMAQHGLDFARSADKVVEMLADGLRVRLFYNQSRLIALGSTYDPTADAVQNTLDLRTTRAETIVYPGQSVEAARTANWLKGVAESYQEGQSLGEFTGVEPVTTARIFDEMMAQGIEPIWITPATMSLLDLYPLPPASTAYAKEALIEGKNILISSAPVLVDGVETIGWWQVDPVTGETIGVGEDGLHVSLVEWTAISIGFGFPFLINDVWGHRKTVKEFWDYVVCHVVPALGGTTNMSGDQCTLENPFSLPWPLPGSCSFCRAIEAMPAAMPGVNEPSEWMDLPVTQCTVDNCGVERFVFDAERGSPIPLPEMLFTYRDQFFQQARIGGVLSVTGNGGGAPALDLSTSPTASTLQPEVAATFDMVLGANFADDAQVTVYTPDGWFVHLVDDGAGVPRRVEIVAPPDAMPGNYTVTLVAQSNQYPEAFAVFEHPVTLSSANAMPFAVTPEGLITVPIGQAAFDDVSNQTNDAEAEISDAAYVIELWNQSALEKPFAITVSGAPADWIILNGARQSASNVTLLAGARAKIGLYVSPPTLPTPGTSLDLTITASDGGSLSASEIVNWVMPSQAFNFLTFQPFNQSGAGHSTLYLGPNSSIDFTLEMTNVGNAAGDFPVAASLPPVAASVSGLPASVMLAVGETGSFSATLQTRGVPLGSKFPIVLGSPAPDSYTQYAVAEAQIVSEITEPVFIASETAANTCTLGEPGLSAALQSLALAMVHLEATCLSGTCNLFLRDQAVNAGNSVALYSGAVAPGVVQDDAIAAAAAELAAHTTDADILADLQALSNAVIALDSEVCDWSQHKPRLTWTPYYGAALQNQAVPYTLTLTNLGTLATTYQLTVTLPGGTLETGQWTLAPGAAQALDYNPAQPDIGIYDLRAVASVVGRNSISTSAVAKLNVVDKFVQLTAVTPDPAFVETGVSSTHIFVVVANNANILQPATAHLEILHPAGAVHYSADVLLTVLVGAPRTYDLGVVDTSGWETGVYTVSVALLDPNGALIPDGANYGYLSVGQLLGISHDVVPHRVAPGTVTVTTVLTTEILAEPIVPNLQTKSIMRSLLSDHPANQSPVMPGISIPLPSLAPASTDAITRTEDTDPAITYTGVWAVVTNANALRASHGDFTWADANGEAATFTFDGTWLHLGFVTDWGGGQAEIFVDGASQGIVDTYTRDPNVVSFVYTGLADTTHTLQIVVLGTHHPNARDTDIRLDFIDTWDGTLYPDGLVEQDNPRVWRSVGWVDVVDANASGGSYMDSGGANTRSAWFPFTGDSVTFIGLANNDGFNTEVFIDGIRQENFWLYNRTSITRTISFDGLDAGPHVMMVSYYFGEPNVDAFATPAIEPGYLPPVYTGMVRYEEDDPAVAYNGYLFAQRPTSWAWETSNSPMASGIGDMTSETLNDTVSLNFYGRWVAMGVLIGNDAGLAEVFIDGVSRGTVSMYHSGFMPMEFQFGDLITGTHTISVTVLDQPNPPGVGTNFYLDYFETWDGAPLPDDFANVHKGTPSGRLHHNKSGVDATHANAIEGNYFSSGLSNSSAEVWYSFTGTSFSLYGLTRNNTTNVNVYVDGQFIENASFDYPYSEQPFVFHYTGFDDGPHIVRVHNASSMRLDGFISNPTSSASYQPVVEWYESDRTGGASIWGGLHVPVAVGDVNEDGLPEIVVASSNLDNSGELFLLRGDGGDTGDGDPIIWSVPYNIFNGFEDVGAPAIAELDGLPGAEIIHPTIEGIYVYHNDGSTYWYTDTFHSHAFFASPAVGNLDLDPEPEIVVNMNATLIVFEPDGTVAWQQVFPSLGMPVLADLTGDGMLDILVHESGTTNVYLYDYNYGSPVLEWTQSVPSALSIYGSPAVADIDGLQPGGDPGPEVAIASNGMLNILDGEDGSFVWSTPLGSGDSSGVSIADVDGDGEVEMVTGIDENGGMIYAVNADGSILWGVPGLDNSPLNPSLFDLNGDGVYEITFNGANQGLTIYNGPDGAVIFNEPNAGVVSKTGSDFPLFADVDNDGYGELVVASQGGLRIFGWDTVWGPARPLWNQLTYHITNVNDDLSIPISEPNSWESHNTFRTQTVLASPMPSYAIALTHTVGITDVAVLPDTFNVPPSTSNYPAYGWNYTMSWESTLITYTFDLRLSNLQPGESRRVAEGTVADYRGPGGRNHLALPPLYASVPHIVDVQPAIQTVGAGATAIFTVTLTNPSDESALYTLSVGGFPTGWAQTPGPVTLLAGDSVNVQLVVAVPPDAEAVSLPFNVALETNLGGVDQTGGELVVLGPLVQVEVTPGNQTVTTGDTAAFNLAVTNLDAAPHTYNLSGLGLAALDLPAQITLGANSMEQIAFSAQAVSEGANPFSVIATEIGENAAGEATASVTGEGFYLVDVTLSPAVAASGPGVATSLDVIVTNLGSVPTTYDLAAFTPAGWAGELTLFGQPVSTIRVPPGAGNSVTLQLLVTPAAGAAPGSYDVSVTAHSSLAADTGTGVVAVGTLGVSVDIIAGPSAMDSSGIWQVQVTNNGAAADTYDLAAFGPFGPFAQLSPASVSLPSGGSQTFVLNVSGLGFLLANDYRLGVHAQSQTQAIIQDEDTTIVAINTLQNVVLSWQPVEQALETAGPVFFSLAITNTGNVQTTYQIAIHASGGASTLAPVTSLSLSARNAAALLVVVTPAVDGIYTITATANSGNVQASATARLVVGTPGREIYLPLIFKGVGP